MPKRAKRIETERRLVEAVGELWLAKGFAGLGVNAVAAQAGVDKALIYRYFGGLPELLRAYGESASFWPTVDELLGPSRELLREPDVARLATGVLRNLRRGLVARPLTLDLLAWEGAQRNALTMVLEEVRERRAAELYAALARAEVALTPHHVTGAALLVAAINYLSVRGRYIETFTGVEVGTDAAWERLFVTMEALLRGLSSGAEGEPLSRDDL